MFAKLIYLPDNVINANNTMGPGRSTIVNNSCTALHPYPSTITCQKSIVFSSDLSFEQHYKKISNKSTKFK
jgi:hypothetical protein